jgi:glycosyltransferase involved in cell wall biosynthesis
VAEPEVSVVIPASRQVRLAAALEALAVQSVAMERFEVVVVRDPAAAVVVEPPSGLRLTVLDGPAGSNIAGMRNAGWRAAKGALVAFTDDDCRPAPDWLARVISAAADGQGAFVQGRTEPDPAEVDRLYGLARSQSIVGPSPWFETCNMAYPRALLERLGGFDERFSALGEDADLALRALAAGARREYADEALVWHAVLSRSLVRAVVESRRRNTIPLLIAKHPSQRNALYMRVFWKRSHALALLAAAGIAYSPRSRLALVAVLPWLRSNTRWPSVRGHPRRIARHALHLGAQACVDTVEVGSTAVSAARNRSLVL